MNASITPKKSRLISCLGCCIFFSFFIFQSNLQAQYTIDGVEYSACSTPETLTSAFNNPAGALTTNTYRDKVLIHVTGVGQSLGTVFNDGFYLYNNVTSNHNNNYYQLVTTIDPLVQVNTNDNAYQHIVYDVDAGTETTPPYVPAYKSDHIYTVVIDMATLIPAPAPGTYMNLRLGVGDGNYGDNSGQYALIVTQLCCPDSDGDGTDDCYDICPFDPNDDEDDDGICADVDPCPLDPANDIDGDGFCADVDNCQFVSNPDQEDSDCDSVGDACDNCPGGDDTIDNSGPDGTPDGIGDCSQLLDYDDYPDAWKCGKKKILVCHNGNNPHTICINKNALPAHLAHEGDYVGPCEAISCSDDGLYDSGAQVHALDIEIQPNPAVDQVIFRTSDLNEIAFMQIVDMLGQTIWKQEVKQGVNEFQIYLDPSIFPCGVYHVQLRTVSNDMISKILITH